MAVRRRRGGAPHAVDRNAVVAAVHPLGCTVSVGMAEWNSARDDAADLLVAADRALYEAKNAGRDRVA